MHAMHTRSRMCHDITLTPVLVTPPAISHGQQWRSPCHCYISLEVELFQVASADSDNYTVRKVCMNGGHPSSLLDLNSCGMVFTVSGQLVPLACKTSGCALTAFSQLFPDWQSGRHACNAAVLEMKKLLRGCQPVWRLCNKRPPGSAVGFLERRSCVVLAVVSKERLSRACGCHGLNEAESFHSITSW